MISCLQLFMELDNPFETITHYFLIGGKTCLNHRDEFLMVSTLWYITIYWIRPMVSHNIDYRIVMTHSYFNLHIFLIHFFFIFSTYFTNSLIFLNKIIFLFLIIWFLSFIIYFLKLPIHPKLVHNSGSLMLLSKMIILKFMLYKWYD